MSLIAAISLVEFIPEPSNSHGFNFPNSTNSNVHIEKSVSRKQSSTPSPAPSKAIAALMTPPISTGRSRDKLTVPPQTNLQPQLVRGFNRYVTNHYPFRRLQISGAKKSIIPSDKGMPFDKSFDFSYFQNQTKVKEAYKPFDLSSYLVEMRKKKAEPTEPENFDLDLDIDIKQIVKIKATELDISKALKQQTEKK